MDLKIELLKIRKAERTDILNLSTLRKEGQLQNFQSLNLEGSSVVSKSSKIPHCLQLPFSVKKCIQTACTYSARWLKLTAPDVLLSVCVEIMFMFGGQS